MPRFKSTLSAGKWNVNKPIVQAAFDVLEEDLGTDISGHRLSKHDKTLSLHRISALAGISGAVEGYVLFSMPLDVVLSIVAVELSVALRESPAPEVNCGFERAPSRAGCYTGFDALIPASFKSTPISSTRFWIC